LSPDIHQVAQMALLHDIGIFMTNAPEIGCYGDYPYIAHGYLGRELLEKNGLDNIAPVYERHIGVGISLKDIIKNDLPLPYREMLPLTIEEKIICYADKFYSKSPKYLLNPRPVKKIKKKLLKYGMNKAEQFDEFIEMFGVDYLF
ncbi:MAG: HD domain-containing protein, partial [Bacteroidales bacterium]|nr:HD domain-containing protein [Bacteroidales bacterium]